MILLRIDNKLQAVNVLNCLVYGFCTFTQMKITYNKTDPWIKKWIFLYICSYFQGGINLFRGLFDDPNTYESLQNNLNRSVYNEALHAI